MKKIVFSALLICQFIGVFAQQADHSQYKLPDGKIITQDKLDSVVKAWGNRGYQMTHDSKQPDLVLMSPMTDSTLKKMDEKKADLNKTLNQPAPDFTLTDLAGKRWTLSALKGKIVVLNFWFVACTGCIDEMPHLNDLVKTYKGQQVVFLGLALDDAKAIKLLLTKHAFNYTLLPEARPISNSYNVSMYPTSIVIDQKGIIRFQQVGGQNIQQEITAVISSIIKG